MSPLSPAHGLVLFHCLAAASAALAQALPGPSAAADAPGGPTAAMPTSFDAVRASPSGSRHMPPAAGPAPSGAATAPVYRSAFEGYVPFSDEPPTSWKNANDTVRDRGGWKAYAKEAQGDPAPTSSGPAPAAPSEPHRHGHVHPAPAAGPAPTAVKERP